MAVGLKRPVSVIAAIALLGAFTWKDTVDSTSASFTAIYRSIDEAAIDAYVVDTLLDSSQQIGASQRCVRTDNSAGSRPSALANPPFDDAAIAQRKYLVATLGAYDVAIAMFAENAPEAETAIALTDLNRAAFELRRAANVHAQGDLFIDAPASIVASAGARLSITRNRDDVRRIVVDTGPTITKLLAILRSDIAQYRPEADNVTRRDYERWLQYYDAVRDSSTNGRTKQVAPSEVPRCLAPVIPSTSMPAITDDIENDGSSFPGRAAILARLKAARERCDLVRSFDPEPVLESISALNDTASKALSAPDNAAVQSALLRFRNSAEKLDKALLEEQSQ